MRSVVTLVEITTVPTSEKKKKKITALNCYITRTEESMFTVEIRLKQMLYLNLHFHFYSRALFLTSQQASYSYWH